VPRIRHARTADACLLRQERERFEFAERGLTSKARDSFVVPLRNYENPRSHLSETLSGTIREVDS